MEHAVSQSLKPWSDEKYIYGLMRPGEERTQMLRLAFAVKAAGQELVEPGQVLCQGASRWGCGSSSWKIKTLGYE